jgi:dTDP-4-amino-4,6-dideoxygalactose transaminase
MTDLQGAIGLVQLGKLDRFIDERAGWADYYRRELADLGWLRTPLAPGNSRHGWQAFTCYVDEPRAPRSRNEIMDRLETLGIATRPGTHAIHMLGYYRDRFGLGPDDLPGARDCDRCSVSIPLHNRMSADDYAYVVEALHGID